jgi:hypothetical protein
VFASSSQAHTGATAFMYLVSTSTLVASRAQLTNDRPSIILRLRGRITRSLGSPLRVLSLLAASSLSFAGTVTITSPPDDSSVNSSVHVHATYNGTVAATYMKLWVDGVAGTVQRNTNVFDTQVSLVNGNHLLEVQAQDSSTGVVYTTASQITVATLALNPVSTSLFAGGMQQFTATDSVSSSVTWSATGGSISSGGLYTAGTTTGRFAVTATDSSGNKAISTVVIAPMHTVTIENPQTGSTVNSPVLVHATYDGTVVATYMKVWVDHVAGLVQHSTNSFTTSLYLTTGSHLIEVQAADPSTGLVYTTPSKITVGSGSGATVTVSPGSVTVLTGGTQQFAATDSAGLPITWSATGGAITSTGFYTAGTATGTFNVTATDSSRNTGKATVTVQNSVQSSLNYTTWKNDNLRTGQQNTETFLQPGNVNSTHFGVLFSNTVDGKVFAQPLYMANLSLAGGKHNVVFVATEHDSVYAFDADKGGSPFWHVSLIPAGASTVPQSLVNSTIYPEIGITGTPVIDPSTGTLYVVAETLENSAVVFRLHALDVTTGNEQGGSPVVITASGWEPKEQLQRPGLLLANGNVYIAFGSHGDHLPYHGWIFSYPASMALTATWNTTPTGTMGAIWMAGSGVAADTSGNIYVMTGNGTFDGNANFGDSFVKLSSNLAVVLDYFTPWNQAKLSANDSDLGSGGVLLVPDQPGAFPHEIIGCGKFPAIYVVNRDSMGHFNSGSSNPQIIQEIDNQVGGTDGTGVQPSDKCFTTPAYWQQNLYFNGNNDVIKAFHLDPASGKMSSTPTSKGSFTFVFPGAQPVVSSNGSTNGIVWTIDHSSSVALHAYDATNVATELYRSSGLGSGAKWAVPTVVNSKVYVGTASKLVVFGPI